MNREQRKRVFERRLLSTYNRKLYSRQIDLVTIVFCFILFVAMMKLKRWNISADVSGVSGVSGVYMYIKGNAVNLNC